MIERMIEQHRSEKQRNVDIFDTAVDSSSPKQNQNQNQSKTKTAAVTTNQKWCQKYIAIQNVGNLPWRM